MLTRSGPVVCESTTYGAGSSRASATRSTPLPLPPLGIDLEQVERDRLRDEVTRLLVPRAA